MSAQFHGCPIVGGLEHEEVCVREEVCVCEEVCVREEVVCVPRYEMVHRGETVVCFEL